MSETNHTILERMVAVMNDVGVIGKERTNTFDRYQFRGIDDVYNALQPVLVKHGVVIIPKLLEMERHDFTTTKGTPQQLVVVRVSYLFTAVSDGSSVEVIAPGEGADRGDKAVNKAMSSAYKNAMFQALCIPTDEKKDSESESPELGDRAARVAGEPVSEEKPKPRNQSQSREKPTAGRWSEQPIGWGMWKTRTWGWLAEGQYEGKRHGWIVDQLDRDLDTTQRQRLEFVAKLIEQRHVQGDTNGST